MDDFVRVQVLQAPQDLFGHPDDLELSHGPTAVQLLQNGATFSGLHEQVDALVAEQSAIELSNVLVPETSLELHIGCFKVLYRNLWDCKTMHNYNLTYLFNAKEQISIQRNTHLLCIQAVGRSTPL